MSMLAYPAALGAAAVFAVAIPLEHRAADRAPDAGGLGPRRLGSFIGATLRDRWWLTGMALNTAGVGLHAFALHVGSLAVVQPLLVTSVLFALPINHRLRREPVKAVELGWAAALTVGLAGFLLVATAGVPNIAQAADPEPAVAAGVLVVVVTGSLALAARRAGRSTASALLGVATGILFAVTASLIKACTDLLVSGPLPLLTSWQLYALFVAGPTGLLLNQLAYSAGPLSASLPAITVVDPLASILLGVAVFDENLRHTLPATAGEVIFLGLLVAAGINLARLERLPSPAAVGHSAP